MKHNQHLNIRTNEMENMALDVLQKYMQNFNPSTDDVCEVSNAINIAYHIHTVREWRNSGGTMMGFKMWSTALERNEQVEVRGETGG